MAFSHVSRPVRDITGKTFARKFITLGKVIHFWPEAVGAELASKTYPIGMSVRKNGKDGATAKNLTATLEIAASSADATLIHYQKGLILERLKTLLGAAMIVDIKITHAAMKPLSALRPANTMMHAAQRAPLTTDEKTCLSQGTENVTDPELRAVLENFGRLIANHAN